MVALAVLALVDVHPVLSRWLPDGAMVVLLAAGAVLLVGGLLPAGAPESEAGEDYGTMKRCHGCGKMVPPDTIRCPNCGAKFTSLYDNL